MKSLLMNHRNVTALSMKNHESLRSSVSSRRSDTINQSGPPRVDAPVHNQHAPMDAPSATSNKYDAPRSLHSQTVLQCTATSHTLNRVCAQHAEIYTMIQPTRHGPGTKCIPQSVMTPSAFPTTCMSPVLLPMSSTDGDPYHSTRQCGYTTP